MNYATTVCEIFRNLRELGWMKKGKDRKGQQVIIRRTLECLAIKFDEEKRTRREDYEKGQNRREWN